jgi:hypothetical protein
VLANQQFKLLDIHSTRVFVQRVPQVDGMGRQHPLTGRRRGRLVRRGCVQVAAASERGRKLFKQAADAIERGPIVLLLLCQCRPVGLLLLLDLGDPRFQYVCRCCVGAALGRWRVVGRWLVGFRRSESNRGGRAFSLSPLSFSLSLL